MQLFRHYTGLQRYMQALWSCIGITQSCAGICRHYEAVYALCKAAQVYAGIMKMYRPYAGLHMHMQALCSLLHYAGLRSYAGIGTYSIVIKGRKKQLRCHVLPNQTPQSFVLIIPKYTVNNTKLCCAGIENMLCRHIKHHSPSLTRHSSSKKDRIVDWTGQFTGQDCPG